MKTQPERREALSNKQIQCGFKMLLCVEIILVCVMPWAHSETEMTV